MERGVVSRTDSDLAASLYVRNIPGVATGKLFEAGPARAPGRTSEPPTGHLPTLHPHHVALGAWISLSRTPAAAIPPRG